MKKECILNKLSTLFLIAASFVVAMAFFFSFLCVILEVKALLILGIIFTVLGTFSCIWGSNIGLKSDDRLSLFCIGGFFLTAIDVVFLVLAICFIF